MLNRLECRYDDQVTDIPENQILLAGLSASVRRTRDAGVGLKVRRLLSVLSEVCSIEGVDLRATRAAFSYHRLNEPYREAHDLAWLVLDALGVEDLFARGRESCFVFLLDMNRLFEDFVYRWLRQSLRGSLLQVVVQRSDRSILWNADLDRPYSQVRPDVLIRQGDRIHLALAVDAKYKLYDDRELEPGDIYQMSLYAVAYGGPCAERLPTALLLYPASQASGRVLRLQVRTSTRVPKAELTVMGVHLPTALAEASAGQPGPLTALLIQRVHQLFKEPGTVGEEREPGDS
jgi:5-methylcytosine-specific restriction enzyme subunit McrC